MASLKSLVSAISALLFLATPVIGPSFLRRRDVPVLASLGASRQQDHEARAVPAEIHPVPRPPVDPVLQNTAAHALDVRKIADLDPSEGDGDFRSGSRVQVLEPSRERAVPALIHILPDQQHTLR